MFALIDRSNAADLGGMLGQPYDAVFETDNITADPNESSAPGELLLQLAATVEGVERCEAPAHQRVTRVGPITVMVHWLQPNLPDTWAIVVLTKRASLEEFPRRGSTGRSARLALPDAR